MKQNAVRAASAVLAFTVCALTLRTVCPGKEQAEQAHRSAMASMETRIQKLEQQNAARVHRLESELDRRATMIDSMSDEMTEVQYLQSWLK